MKIKRKLATLILIILISGIINKIHLLSNNTLEKGNVWDSEKSKLELDIMGAEQFLTQTQTLNSERLDLSAWHGFQEVITKTEYDYEQMEFDFFIEKEAYLIVHLFVKDNYKHSIKIADDPKQNSCLKIDENGKFLSNNSIENLRINVGKWNHAKITFKENFINLEINKKLFTCEVPIDKESSKIGFKGSYHKSLVDNVSLRTGNKIIFKENFSNKSHLSWPFFISLFSLIIISIILIGYFDKLILILISINISLIIYCFYLVFFFVGNYPSINFGLNNLKNKEEEYIENITEKISNEIMNAYLHDEEQKIMFIGSSQTEGTGASEYKKTFTAILEEKLNKNLIETPKEAAKSEPMIINFEKKINIVNTGISGLTSVELIDLYQEKWIQLNPKIVFINLSSNDFSYEINKAIFKKNIEKFIEINKKNNIETVLMLEANSHEKGIENQFHSIMKKVSKENDVYLIDTNEFLKEKDSTGLLWWDFVHLSDYGQELVAEYIFDFLTQKFNISQETDL